MGEERTQTFIMGEGILTLPNGEELKISSFTLTFPPTEDIRDGDGVIVHSRLGRGPIKMKIKGRV